MASKELIEKVASDIAIGIYEDTPPNAMAVEILSTILAALQEPTSRMLREVYIVQDDAALVNKASVPTFSDYWYAAINASPLGEQSDG